MDEITAEEYQVYSDLLRHLFERGNSIVLKDHTSNGLQNPEPWDQVLVESLAESFGIQVDQSKNVKSYKLEPLFTLDEEIILLSDVEQEQIFEEGGWDAFREKYGRCGIAGVSRVAFSRDRKLAVLSFGIQAGYHFGHGFYALLEYENEKWNLKHQFPTWRS